MLPFIIFYFNKLKSQPFYGKLIIFFITLINGSNLFPLGLDIGKTATVNPEPVSFYRPRKPHPLLLPVFFSKSLAFLSQAISISFQRRAFSYFFIFSLDAP